MFERVYLRAGGSCNIITGVPARDGRESGPRAGPPPRRTWQEARAELKFNGVLKGSCGGRLAGHELLVQEADTCMVTRVVRVRARAVVGDTVMVDGRAAVVVHLLPREPGRPRAARATHDPPCQACERGLQYDALHRRWRCPDCRATYTPTALAAVCLRAERSARQLQRGIPGATALLLRAAQAGGALSRDTLLESVSGAERHAMRWALRDTGDGPLSPERCRQAAQVLFAAR